MKDDSDSKTYTSKIYIQEEHVGQEFTIKVRRQKLSELRGNFCSSVSSGEVQRC